MYELNGEEVDLVRLEELAKQYNMDVNTYIQKMTDKGRLIAKQPGVAATDAGAAPQPVSAGTESASVDTSLESQKKDTESQEEDTWIERTVGKNIVTDYFGDLWRAGKQGLAQGATVDEAFDVYKKGKDISDEELMRYIEVSDALDKTGASDEMREYERIKEEAGGGVWGFMKGTVMTRGQWIPQVIVSSAAGMARTFFDSEEAAGITTATAGAGALAGAGASAAAGSIGGPIGTAVGGFVGAGTGAIGGAVAGLTGSMETALTLTELLKTELGDKEFNKENIRAILEDEKVFEDIKDRALARGITIGAIEGITVGLSRGVGANLVRKGASKGAIARKVTGVEMGGGMVGEGGGQLAAGQEFDVAEVLMEGVAEAKGVVNVADILAKKEYKINGEKRTRKEVIDKVNNMKPENLAKVQFDITGDKNLKKFVNDKQNDAILDSQIDAKITDQKDRDKLVELERQREKAEADTKKKGAYKVPDADQNLADIENEISDIIGKYEGAVGFGESEAAQEVAKARRDISVAETIAFAEAAGKKIGKFVHVADDNASAQETFNKIREEHNKKAEEHNAKPENADNQIKLIAEQDVTNSDGFIVGDSIVINKDIAGRTGAISVGSHEILHGVLAKHMQGLDVSGKKKLISSFKDVLSKKQLNAVTKRLQDNYKAEIEADPEFLETTDEWFTAFSDAIEKGDVTFDENVFGKLKNVIHEILRAFGIKKEFSDGRAAYNFLKEYHKNVKEGKLGKRAIALAGGGITATETSFSRSKAVDAVNAIEDVIKKGVLDRGEKYNKNSFQQSRRFSDVYSSVAERGGAINNYVRSLGMSPEKTQETIDVVTDRLINYNPETQRKGVGTDPITLGEFIMANVGFAKKDAAKKLAVEGAKKKQETRLDAKDETGRAVAEKVADEPVEIDEVVDPKKRVRKLKDFDVELKDSTIDEQIITEVEALIEKNPDNIQERLDELIDKQFRKLLDRDIGKIAKDKQTGETAPTVEYDKFIRNEYQEIVGSLGIKTIRTSYKNWFEKKKIGTEKKKGISEKTGKTTNYVVGIYENTTNKREYLRYFLEGKPGVLRERRTALLKRIARRKAENAVDTYIENNSKDLDAIREAELRKLSKIAENNIDEQKSFDKVKFSKSDQKVAEELGVDYYKLDNIDGVNQYIVDMARLAKKITPGILNITITTSSSTIPNKELQKHVKKELKKKVKFIKDPKRAKTKFDTKLLRAKSDAQLQELNERNVANFTDMWNDIRKAVQEDKSLITPVLHFLRGSIDEGTHTHRLGAELISLDKTVSGDLYFEHALQNANAYRLLIKAAVNADQKTWNKTLKALKKNYKLIAISAKDNVKIDKAGFKNVMSLDGSWDIFNNAWFERYFNEHVAKHDGGINPDNLRLIGSKETLGDQLNINAEGNPKGFKLGIDNIKTTDKAVSHSRSTNNDTKGISILDFDDTLATTKSKILVTAPNGEQFKLNAEEFAEQGAMLLEEGHKFDFSEFNQVVDGKTAPLFNKALKLAEKFGTDDMYILTARAPESQAAIKQFLDANGLNIPIKNIVGLGRSEASAKAEWVAEKVGEGFNDFYFADDAIQNVRAVGDMLSKSNVKAKVQQAKVKFSLSTKRNLSWETDSIGYMTTSFNVDGNNYNITFYPTDLDDVNFELEFDLVTEAGVTQEMTGTGNQFKVLSIVYNGLLDVIKQKPNIETIGFSALTKDESRTKVYTVLMDRLSKKLRWKTNMYEYSSGTQIDFELTKPKVTKRKAKTTQSIKNIPAVQNMLSQFDVKSKVQQGRVKFSKSMDADFNNMLEDITGIEAEKRFSMAKARKRGKNKGKFRLFIPPSHEDLVGLLYNFMGKGKVGDMHRAFWERAIIKPLNRGMRELDVAKQSIASDFKELNKRFENVKKKLKRQIPSGDFTFEDAIRVYIWDKNGYSIPGLSETDQQTLVDTVLSDRELKAYADSIEAISKQDGYVKPSENWEVGDLRTDLNDATSKVGRTKYLAEFLENAKIIFSEENLNKIEAAFGKDLREAIEDMLYRIETGRNRPTGSNALVNKFVNFINGAVGATMFFNIRSAVLQQMSIVNFLNFADNNIFAAAKAFADQKQFWADFAYIFNSAEMKQRRGGIGTDVNGAELAASIANSRNPIQKAIAELLRIGFTPTQLADSFAIAIGGAPYYRNRVKTYIKQGFSKAEAEAKAWEDFQEIAQATQQSARPDMVSQQQASPLGKFILAFQNVTSQFNRLGKKAFLDIKNRRITKPNTTQLQSDISNASRIVYYLAVQNLVFYGLQTAVFAMMFDADEDDEQLLKKKGRIINGSIDSVLRGTGVYGAIIATLKNMAIKHMEQREAGYNKDEAAVLLEMLNVSPPLGIKARQIVNAEKTLNYEKDAIEEMETFDIDNPQWSAVANYVSATTNVPLAQVYRNIQNARNALDNRYSTWQRILMSLGWSKWNIGAGDVEEDNTKKSKKKKQLGEPTNSGKSSRYGGSQDSKKKKGRSSRGG